MHLRGPEFLAFASVHLLALLSPGPDFAIVLKSSLTYTRKKALLVALGIAIGVVFHVSYSLIGLDFIQQRAHITILLRYIGSFYLIFIGVKSLCSRKDNKPVSGLEIVADDLSSIQALKLGFFTNILNIKAAFFTLSIFSVMLGPETSLVVKIFYGSFIIVTVFLRLILSRRDFMAQSIGLSAFVGWRS